MGEDESDVGLELGNPLGGCGLTDDDGIVLWVRYRIDQGDWQNVSTSSFSVWGFEVQMTGFAAGRHYVDVKAFDGANESDIKSISFLIPEKAKPKKTPGLEAPAALVALIALAYAVSRTRRR